MRKHSIGPLLTLTALALIALPARSRTTAQAEAASGPSPRHFVCAQSAGAGPSPLDMPITLGVPQTGQSASDRPGTRFVAPTPLAGRLVYAWDTGPIHFSGLGNEPPWQSYLTLRPLGSDNPTMTPSSPAVDAATYPITIPKYESVFQTQFSPDGTKVLLKVGNYLTTDYFTYRPLILDLKTKALTEIEAPHQSIGDITTLWSQDSRYIAYLRRGFGLPFGGEDTAQLHVYDTQTSRDQQVVENQGVRDSFAWTTAGRLLYTVFPAGRPPTRPPADLYQFSATTGKSVLLRHDAYRPVSSPDGKEVVFLSVTDPRSPVKHTASGKAPYRFTYEYAANKYLTLWSRVSGKLRVIRQEQAPQFDRMLWLPDSRGLVLFNRRTISESQEQADITAYDLATDRLHNVAAVS